MGEYLVIIVGFLVLVLIFIIFRSVILWFWKVNTHIELMTENNNLLKNILAELKVKSINTEDSIQGLKEIIRDESVKKVKPKKEPLTNKIKEIFVPQEEELNEMIKKLQDHQLIIKIKANNMLAIMDKAQYELDKELHLSNSYEVVYLNKDSK